MTDELGNMLLKAGRISEGQLTKALELHGEGKGKLDEILIRMGVVGDEDELSTFIGKQLNIGAVKLSDIELNPDVVKLIPVDIARKFNVIAVSKINRTLVVAISDPNNIYVLDAVKFITGCNVQPVISPEAAISKAIDSYYIESNGFSDIIRDIEESDLEVIESREDSLSDQDLQSQVQDKPLVKLVDSMVADAIRKGVSDIHIECYEKRIRVRFRKDGKLSEMAPLPFKYRAAIISRVKIMADLDISERRLPQDGRIKVKVAERTVDLRVSVLPTIFGEKVVMRILDPRSLMVDMTQLGFERSSLEAFDRVIHLPFGIILVTGPTGSGKTTTLYSALKQLNTTDVNIMTAEDPVEFNFDGINQVQVRSDIGLTFASSLRSFLRQDPDIIMVGEIRDTETAEIAIRAALTGHLVFATLHTNDAPSTISRLIDMGIPPFLVASSTKLIMAQRMVRLLCKKCKRPVKVAPEQLLRIGIPEEEIGTFEVYEGKGCKDCGDSGMSGRNGIFEVMPITATLERMILQGASVPELREQACKEEHMLTLRQAAIMKLKTGMTNLQEVLATTASDQ
ncbi:MAG: type IV-A pilus assembly ATPase PilB [candidate division Zixibacteria bacterium]|nr:type IV-A pilus assembly ATPase PilB [candidate division Zixibacteria bacterium]MBU1471703.1 type IV-A pilus assembly ATPase PilB [candidate division Zixibacteria bacterium]